MPSVTVAWFDKEDEEAGYHVCRNCEIGQSIESDDLVITSEDKASKDYKPCPECELHQEPHSRRPRRMPRCAGISIPTK